MANSILGQDIFFTQFWTPMSYNNPALLANFEGSTRVSALYRNQWSQFGTALQSTFADFTTKISSPTSIWAFGVSALNDRMALLHYDQYRLLLSASYTKQLNEKIALSGGLQSGFKMISIDYNKLNFDKQWDPSTGNFNNWTSSNESFDATMATTLLFNVGLNLNFQIKDIRNSIDCSVSNINTPNEVYYNNAPGLPMKYILGMHSDIPLSSLITIKPKNQLILTNATNSFTTGSLVTFAFSPQFKASGGLLYRWGVGRTNDALIPYIGCAVKRLDIGLSYDLTLSALSSQSSKGTYELSIVYRFELGGKKYYSIDCMRL